jgi:butyrate kinase
LRSAAIWAAQKQNVQVDEVNYVVVHMGGGISVAAVREGRIIDVNDASSAGPFSPERSGTLPLLPVIDLCFSGQFTQAQMKKMVMGEGGVKAYLGTADVTQVEKMIQNGNASAKLVFDAMVYQIAKEIGAMATVLSGKISAIVLTGGLAHSTLIIRELKKRISFIAPVIALPGELEMEAMALGAQRVLMGEEFVTDYC